MGNHSVGRAMVAIALTANDRRKPNETALEILDLAADASDIRGADAEFDDATMPGEPFQVLIMEAFAPPGRVYDFTDDDGFDSYYEEVYSKFRARYNLC